MRWAILQSHYNRRSNSESSDILVILYQNDPFYTLYFSHLGGIFKYFYFFSRRIFPFGKKQNSRKSSARAFFKALSRINAMRGLQIQKSLLGVSVKLHLWTVTRNGPDILPSSQWWSLNMHIRTCRLRRGLSHAQKRGRTAHWVYRGDGGGRCFRP